MSINPETASDSQECSALSRCVRSFFFPDLIVSSPLAIDYDQLVSSGFRVALVDIDNTLACHGSHACDPEAAAIIEKIQDAGLVPVIVSNAGMERARTYADSLQVEFIAKAKKPRTGAICLALENLGCLPEHTITIGDQLLTDVWSARRAGIPVILTDKRSNKEIFTVRLKRPLEWILIRCGGKARWQTLRENYSRLIKKEK